MSEMDAYKDIFLSESAEFLQAMSDGLLELEKDATDLAPVETVFRGAHSLKGMAAAMGYDRTSDLTHKMESLLDRVRQRELPADSPLIDLMLEATDLVKEVIADESSGGTDVDTAEMTTRIAEWSGGAAAEVELPEEPAQGVEPTASERPAQASAGSGYRAVVTLDEHCVLKAVRAYMVIKRLSHMGTVIDTVPTGREIEDEEFELEFEVVLSSEGSAQDVEAAVLAVSEVTSVVVSEEELPEDEEADEEAGDEAARRVSRKTSIPKLSETQTVRISIGHLDTMVDLVGELVILRSRLGDIVRSSESPRLADAVEELHRVAGELQHEVMLTRMVPVGNIFNRFPRMVRDLARDLGKEVEFEMAGLDIELDRTVLDEIGDPIVHLLRNSVDHGVEPAEERVAAGKPAAGVVRLTACRERDNVHIEVSDDGRGIDCDRVWGKAIESGLAATEERDGFTDEQILMFTCVPGFSTSVEATKVSGRGVGMDVVKGKIEHLGGTLEITSTPGHGTKFSLTLPLTLAIIQALLIELGGQVFAMPLAAVDEVISPRDVKLDTVDGAPVVVLRDGTVVPLFALDALLDTTRDPHRMPGDDEQIILVDAGGQPRAVFVETLLGRDEIVIKPLSRLFRGVHGFGGATILGDGSVALILDPRTVFPAREEGP